MSRTQVLVDERGRRIGSPDGTTVGFPGTPTGRRMVWAFPTNAPGGGLSRRYSPPWAPGEEAVIGLDLSQVIPPGTGIALATLVIAPSPGDFVIAPLTFADRQVWATMTGGVSGTDYQCRWLVTDTSGNVIPRTALLLCAPTS